MSSSKERESLTDTPESKFRVLALVAKASRRFMVSLNPPVTFGKRAPSDGSPGSSPSHSSPVGTSNLSALGRDAGVLPKHQGHKAGYVFAPLAPLKSDKTN